MGERVLSKLNEREKNKRSVLSAFDTHYSNNPTFQYSMWIRAHSRSELVFLVFQKSLSKILTNYASGCTYSNLPE